MQIVGFSVLGGILLGLFIDAHSQPLVVINKAEAASSTVEQRVLIEVVYDWSRERINKEIDSAAAKYGVNAEKMKATIQCESQYQVEVKSHYTGEDSWGLAQFHIPSRNRTAEGKVMTREMAVDPIVAIDTMAFMFSQGNARAWSCYRQLF